MITRRTRRRRSPSWRPRTDGSTSNQSFTINLTDDTSESAVGAVTDTDGAANSVGENVANGAVVGITAFATDADATDTVSYSLSNDAGGAFTIDPTTGVVTVADSSLLDYETATSETIEVTATSTDGSTSVQSFVVGLTDDNTEFSVTPVIDNDGAANTVSESVANGAVVGITALASDADGTDTVSYSPEQRLRRCVHHRSDHGRGHGRGFLASRLRDGPGADGYGGGDLDGWLARPTSPSRST